ncbi:MAG: YihY/virulence factor BrkB family protein [Acidobacteria bacterium]|nr:MAG: YihY/virulence factor BrkB family protein [Acidobacteriota bacterium]
MRDVISFLKTLYIKASEDEISSHAAQIAFYFFFSIFPLILFLITLFGLLLKNSDELQLSLFARLRQVMPESAYGLIEKTLQEVTERSSGGKLTLGILAVLWSASAGFDSISSALNRIYNFQETRSWWLIKLTSLSLTFIVGVLICIVFFVSFYGISFFSGGKLASDFVENSLILLALFFIFALVDNLCPNRGKKGWRWMSWGALFSISSWLLVSVGFDVYLKYFDTYARIYGSLGAVIILMIWFYLSAMMILIGAEINSIFEEGSKDVFDASRNH